MRLTSYIEGISYLFLLLIAMPFKYFLDQPQLVSIGGMFHGVMFVLYILTAVQAFVQRRWSLNRALLIIGCIFIPFLFIKQDRMIHNEELELKKSRPVDPKKRA
ncbi:DUF3817 domain-containing protein [Paenibacillus alginolyticus]|uniref:DUF3817 domain-containing protein n=1 Tax=Paenibacillus alginolyticus TaxID=59839 RepID=A0ABT4GJU3_9BACL|nr:MULTISPECIES: DUF3817 domain-containing protein [Paenibacillus]MCY9668168.1 DUF3817 domain-containing protein [Paenibacillus alginolyticus]MCY9696465.1 DUF3817 domain-containing protein [Paenibacillus alginolyticus]MEC0144728.1 DUF3817 domain-containing protein [Paenibacillus alginolyticus]